MSILSKFYVNLMSILCQNAFTKFVFFLNMGLTPRPFWTMFKKLYNLWRGTRLSSCFVGQILPLPHLISNNHLMNDPPQPLAFTVYQQPFPILIRKLSKRQRVKYLKTIAYLSWQPNHISWFDFFIFFLSRQHQIHTFMKLKHFSFWSGIGAQNLVLTI